MVAQAGNGQLTRMVLQRGVGCVYLIGFVVALSQAVPLIGEDGLLPLRRFVEAVPFRRSPSLFHLRATDGTLRLVAGLGTLLSLAVVAGGVERTPLWASTVIWLALWALYLSIVNVGQVFYGFGWETLLLEAGFLCAFLGNESVAPPIVVLWLFRWLAIRVELGAGLIKLRGDPCWRDFTCLRYHHQTQPLPNPLSWYFHHLPDRLHKVEVVANHGAQLILPVLLLAPQPVAAVAAGLIIVTQCWLLLSGNFSWLNLLTIIIVAAAVPDGVLGHVFGSPPAETASPNWWLAIVVAVVVVLVALSWRPLRNLCSSGQRMNTSFDPLHLVNSYGAFGSITRHRDELIIEGTMSEELGDDTVWLAYEFRAKPGDPSRRPPQIAPYHLRLDWLMWFAALGSPRSHPWIVVLAHKLLDGDRRAIKLLRQDPFDGQPPAHIRIMRYRYTFTTRAERQATGRWWNAQLIGPYLPVLALDDFRPRRESIR